MAVGSEMSEAWPTYRIVALLDWKRTNVVVKSLADVPPVGKLPLYWPESAFPAMSVSGVVPVPLMVSR